MFSVSLTGSEIRNKHAGNDWKVFAESAGDLTNFPSTEVTIPSPVSVLSTPVIESFTYNAINQTLDLKWSEIQDAGVLNKDDLLKMGCGKQVHDEESGVEWPINVEVFDHCFPFFIIFNHQLVITHMGSSMASMFPEIIPGRTMLQG